MSTRNPDRSPTSSVWPRAIGALALVVAAVLVPQSAQAASSTAARTIKNIAYAPAQPAASQGHLLDLYLPRHSHRPTPLVIWSHGSGWEAENGRDGADVVASHFNPLG